MLTQKQIAEKLGQTSPSIVKGMVEHVRDAKIALKIIKEFEGTTNLSQIGKF